MISALSVMICAFTTEAGHSPDMERTQDNMQWPANPTLFLFTIHDSRFTNLLARAVNPVEGQDEKNGAQQSKQQVG